MPTMGARRPALIAVSMVLAATRLASATPRAGDRDGGGVTSVSLVGIYDFTGRATVEHLRGMLEKAIRANGQLRLLAFKTYTREARRRGLPRRVWAEPDTIKEIASSIGLDVPLLAWLIRSGKEYQLTLSALDGQGRERDRVLVRLGKARLTAALAEEAVTSLVRHLTEAGATASAQGPGALERGGQARIDGHATSNALADGNGGDVEQSSGEGGEAWNVFDMLDSEASDEAIQLASLNATLGGRIAAVHHSYLARLPADKVAGKNAIDLALQAKAKTTGMLIAGTLLVRQDFSDPSQDRFEAEEAYIEVEQGPVKLRAGRAIVAWGAASLMNPTDVINPVDLRDPLQSEKRGAWLVRAGLLLGEILLEAYYLPVASGHLLPLPTGIDDQGRLIGSSRWLGDEVLVPDGQMLRAHTPELVVPPAIPQNTQAALRSSWSMLGADLSLGWAYQFDHFPTLYFDVQPAPPFLDITPQLRFERVHQLTADAERAFGKLHLAAETLVLITKDVGADIDELDDPAWTIVAGGDYRTSELLPNHYLHVFLELIYCKALLGDLRGTELSEIRYPTTLGVLARVRYEVGQNLRFDLNGLASLKAFDVMLNPEIEYLFLDKVTMQLGAVFLFGDRSAGYFARFYKNSRVQASLEVNF